MKRRFLAFAASLVLCISLSTTVFAGTASQSGNTSGGYSGIATTSANLSANSNSGQATTGSGTSDGITCATSIIYYYLNSNGQTQANSAGGSSSAMAGCSGISGTGTKATSQHSVNGGARWGSWSCSLSTNAW